MKRVLLVVLVLVVAAFGLAVGALWLATHGGARGSGGLVTEERDLPPFHAVRIDGLADLTLVEGKAEHVAVELPARQRKLLSMEVTDGVLRIRTDEHRRWWRGLFGGPQRTPRIRLHFRSIDDIEASGALKLVAAKLQAERLAIHVAGAAELHVAELAVDRLDVDGSGAIKAELTGRARRQTISIAGAGDYRAADLASDDVSVDMSGAGKVILRAEKSLDVTLSGAGSVEYLGNPRVKESVSGVGSVRRRTPHDSAATTPASRAPAAATAIAATRLRPAASRA